MNSLIFWRVHYLLHLKSNSLIFWRVHCPLAGKSRTRQKLEFGEFNRSQNRPNVTFWSYIWSEKCCSRYRKKLLLKTHNIFYFQNKKVSSFSLKSKESKSSYVLNKFKMQKILLFNLNFYHLVKAFCFVKEFWDKAHE